MYKLMPFKQCCSDITIINYKDLKTGKIQINHAIIKQMTITKKQV